MLYWDESDGEYRCVVCNHAKGSEDPYCWCEEASASLVDGDES